MATSALNTTGVPGEIDVLAAEKQMPGAGSWARQQNELNTTEEAERGAKLADMRTGIEGVQKTRREAAAVERPPFNVPEFDAHKMETAQFTKKAAGLFAILAIAGSKILRTGSTGAMNALNGALQGLHTGNQAAYTERMAEYQNHVQVMLANHKEELQKYYDIQNNKNLSIQEQLDEIKLVSMAHDNNLVNMAARQGSLDKVWTAIGQYSKAGKQLHDTRTPEQKNYTTIMKQGATNLGVTEAEWAAMPGNDYASMLAKGELRTPTQQKKHGRSFEPVAGTKTPEQWVTEVRAEHPDWKPEQIAAEAKKRAGVK